MNYKEVKQIVKKEYELLLNPLNYRGKNDLQGYEFRFINDFIVYKIGYGIVNYIDEFNIGTYISLSVISIDNIQQIILNEERIIENYATIGTNISSYFGELNYRYHIKTIEDVKEWGKIVRKFYNEYVLPFFEKYSTVEAIDKLLNDNPSEKVIYCSDLSWRIIKGLIAAKLNNNPQYNDLRNYYKSEVESKFQGYFMYDKCMKVIDFLDKYTSEELNKLAESS
ncbi:MAG: hypothetical protein LBV11_00995 [Bacillus cereus]|jgi:hypothetical protein|nr:hypothetical protein [Bacillus cereus]